MNVKTGKLALVPTSSVGIIGTIGNTPVVRLLHVVPKNHADVFVKLECLNPTGSHKDRMAIAIVEKAEDRGHLKPGMTVVEATGGSTGSSLAFVCAAKGYKFRAISSNAFASEKLATMSAFGASIELIDSPGHISKGHFRETSTRYVSPTGSGRRAACRGF
ncbi:hypothetical protein ACKLNR_012924 [Fusarium oxysporum f. sp. zingiberi]